MDNHDQEERKQREGDPPEQEEHFLEETASEVTPAPISPRVQQTDKDEDGQNEVNNLGDIVDISGRNLGIFGFVLSLISLLFMPVLLGAAGIVVGFFARRKDAKTLGNWAMGIGAVSIVVSLFFSPFF